MSERPVECSGCQKPIKYCYKVIEGNAISTSEMCADCPILTSKLRQGPQSESEEMQSQVLCCHKCHTTIEAIQRNSPLGCSECYLVFEGLIIEELLKQEAIAPRLRASIEVNRSIPLHLGGSPTKAPQEITLSKRLQELNSALNEALNKEQYEEAAYLRDQIKELMKKEHER